MIRKASAIFSREAINARIVRRRNMAKAPRLLGQRAAAARRRAERREDGVCVRCGIDPAKPGTRCAGCRETRTIKRAAGVAP